MISALSIATTFVWSAAFWLRTRDRRDGFGLAVAGMLASLIAVVCARPSLWTAIQAGYPDDSFWTLDMVGRAGVIAISLGGILILTILLWLKTRRIVGWKRQDTGLALAIIDCVLGFTLFAAAFSVSPQAYYAFYQQIFPDLPQQWVISGPFDMDRLRAIAKIDASGSLADHLAGVTLWAILPFTLWLHLRDWWRGGQMS